MEAINFAQAHDDGAATRDLGKAQVILVGVSRCGKTPTTLYLALQFGILAANFPLTPDDFADRKLPGSILPYRDRLFGLTIDPERLQQIREERRPDSKYAALDELPLRGARSRAAHAARAHPHARHDRAARSRRSRRRFCIAPGCSGTFSSLNAQRVARLGTPCRSGMISPDESPLRPRVVARPARGGNRERSQPRRSTRCVAPPLLQAGAGAAALGALPGAGQLAAQAQAPSTGSDSRARRSKCSWCKSPRGDLLTKYHKEFEDLTGITVGSEMVPEQQQRQKAVIEFNSGNPSFDVIALSYHVQKRLFGKNKWLADLRPMITDKSLTDPESRFRRFRQGRDELCATQPDGRIDSLPLNLDPWVIYYNKELFDAKGVAYPKSFAEMIDAAAQAQRSRQGHLPASSGAASRTPTCRCGRASCWATAAASSTPTASS